jgi:hypothetical protein
MKRAQMNIFVILHAILGVRPKFCGPLMKNSYYLTNRSTKFGEKTPGTCSHCFLSILTGIGCHIMVDQIGGL